MIAGCSSTTNTAVMAVCLCMCDLLHGVIMLAVEATTFNEDGGSSSFAVFSYGWPGIA